MNLISPKKVLQLVVIILVGCDDTVVNCMSSEYFVKFHLIFSHLHPLSKVTVT